MKLEIVESNILDVRLIHDRLREKDNREAIALGMTIKQAVYHSYRESLLRKTAFINGQIAAMWGVRGKVLGEVGNPYLFTTPEVYKISPIKFAKIYKRSVDEMKKIFPVLSNYVDADYPESIRMLRLAGFTLSGPTKINDHDFYEFRMVD